MKSNKNKPFRLRFSGLFNISWHPVLPSGIFTSAMMISNPQKNTLQIRLII